MKTNTVRIGRRGYGGRRAVAAVIALGFIGPTVRVRAAGEFSAAYIGSGNQDANVGLNPAKTYLQAINIKGNALTINGVNFAAGGGANPSGAGWAVTGMGNIWGPTAFGQVSGELGTQTSGKLGSDFIYGGNPGRLALSGLVTDQTYVVTFYNFSFEAAGARRQNLSSSSGASAVYDEDMGAPGQGYLNLLRYTFHATGTTETVTFSPQIAANTLHLYGFSTEQTFNNAWLAGSDWTLASWSLGIVPNAAGASAALGEAGAPSGLNLDSDVTVGHLQFGGANPWTLSSSSARTLTLRADPGGVAVLGATNGSHTLSTAVALGSDAVKFGNGTLTLTGPVSGAGRAITVDGGVLALGGANSYGGGTTINYGMLSVGADGNLGAPGGPVTIGSATLQATGSFTMDNRAVTLKSGSAILDVAPGATLAISNVVAGAAGAGIHKTGAGTLALSGTNTYSGVTILSAGILDAATIANYGQNSSLGNRAADTGGENMGLLFRGGTLRYAGATPQSTDRQIRLSTFGGGGTIDASGSVPAATLSFTAATSLNLWENPGARTLTLTGSNTGDNLFAMRLADAGGSTHLTKDGAGTWILSGNSAYGGYTDIKAGILRVTTSTALGAGGHSGATMSHIAGGSALELTGSITNNEHLHLAGAGPGGLGALRSISGDNSMTDSGYGLDGSGTVGVDAGTFTLTSFYDASPNGRLTKIGAGTLILTAQSTHSAGTLIGAGTVQLTANNGLPNGREVRVNGTANPTLDLGGNSFDIGDGLLALGDATTGGGTIRNGTVRFNTNTRIYSGTIDAHLVNSGASSRLWIGGNVTAVVRLNGINTFTYADTHATIIGHSTTGPAGTVLIGNPFALGAPTQQTQIFGGMLDLNGQADVQQQSIWFGSVGNGPGYLVNEDTVNTASFNGSDGVIMTTAANIGGAGNLVLGAAVHGANDLTKVGSGTLSLNGNSDYSGATIVSDGTLAVNGTNSGPGSVTVLGGAELCGTGMVAGAVIVAGGGKFAAGNSVGTNTVGSLTLTVGSIFEVEADGAAVDQTISLGAVDLGGATLSTIALSAPTFTSALIVSNATGQITGRFAGLYEADQVLVGGVPYFIHYRPTYVELNLTPTAVVLHQFGAIAEGAGVVVRWRTASEVRTAGFDVYRKVDGEWVKVNDAMIAATGALNGGVGASYSLVDAGAAAGGTYEYTLVEVEQDGTRIEYGPYERTATAFEMTSPIRATAEGMEIRWLSRDGERYRVLRTTDLRTSAAAVIGQGLNATPPENVFVDTNAAPLRVYRVELED